MTTNALADPSDVQRVWRPFGPPFTSNEEDSVDDLILEASAKLRHACPFDVDARIANFAAVPRVEPALDPQVVAGVIATIVKRFLVNIDGYASTSQSMGPFSQSGTFVNRYDKTGSDVRGAIQVIDSDIDQLRPAVPRRLAASVQLVPTRAMQPRSGFLRSYDRDLGWRGDELVDGYQARETALGVPVGNGPDPDDELL